jgi:DNA-binding transcriptional LysR family regulator
MLDDAIRSAVAVARHGSFTVAAEHAGITQSAITKRVADLEQRLGYAIFSRTARGVILTDEGLAFLDRASRLLEDLELLLLQNRDPYVGPLRVGICPAALDGLIVKPIAALKLQYPQVQLDVSSSGFERMMHRLRNGSVDVVLGLERLFKEQTDFNREPLAALEAVFFTRRGHPLEHLKRVPSSALAAFDIVCPSEIPRYTQSIREIFKDVGESPTTRLHAIDYFPLVRVLVSQSDTIGIVSARYAKSAAFQANFAIVDAVEPPPPGDLCCAVRARWEVSPVVKAFIQACQKTLPPVRTAPAQGNHDS